MNRYLTILAVAVGVAAWGLFLLLLPWFTYARAYLFISGVIFAGGSATLYLAWRARRSDSATSGARSRYLLLQGIGLFGVGIAWLFVTHRLLLGR
jgi:hypothetical protein